MPLALSLFSFKPAPANIGSKPKSAYLTMLLNSIDWQILERLRNRFLESGSGPCGVYWQSDDDLAHYHATFAARIGWKWDNALGLATDAGFRPRSRKLFDWGCGTGIAALRAINHFGEDAFDSVTLWDHSVLACRFAQQTIQNSFPKLEVTISPAPSSEHFKGALTLISHALTELSEDAREDLAKLVRSASQLLAVEPGDYAASRKLVALRECLLGDFTVTAPCTHCDACPMWRDANARHWCHFFGKPPVEAFTESFWTQFSQVMEIDLRSLPYSFLALENRSSISDAPSDALPGKASRLIGRPRQFKGYTRLLSCDRHGLRELELQKRDDKQLWKTLKKDPSTTRFQWTEIEGSTSRLKAGKPI